MKKKSKQNIQHYMKSKSNIREIKIVFFFRNALKVNLNCLQIFTFPRRIFLSK